MAGDSEEQFRKDIFQHMEDVKNKELTLQEDFTKQQEMYGKYANIYDVYCIGDEYNGPKFAIAKVKELYQKQKDIKILDYGCGTGLMADHLSESGYTNVDGLDPCKELLNVARSKRRMKNFFELGSEDDDSAIPTDEYDVVCSSGVFFGSPSYPGFKCISKICRYVKPGGHIVISTGNNFVDCESDPDYQIIKDLQKDEKIEIKPIEFFEKYRRPLHATEGDKSIQGILLLYHVL